MGLYITNALAQPPLPMHLQIKNKLSRRRPISRRKTLKRLTPANRRYLISLGFKVKQQWQ